MMTTDPTPAAVFLRIDFHLQGEHTSELYGQLVNRVMDHLEPLVVARKGSNDELVGMSAVVVGPLSASQTIDAALDPGEIWEPLFDYLDEVEDDE